MIELRFTAAKSNGREISGTMSVPSWQEGKKRVSALAAKHRLKVTSVERKVTYLYKVRRGKEKPFTGEQSAYSKDEVVKALTRLGFQVVSVNRKLFDFQGKPPAQEILSFVKISAELLEQKLPYSEIMTLLVNDIENKALKDTLRQINNELKKGADSQKTFLKHEATFGKFAAYMLGLAANSGNMTEIYKATAKFLERRQQFKKDLKSALITPFVTLFVLFVAVLFYIGYIFPATAKLFVKFDIELPPMTDATLKFSEFLTAHPFLLGIAVIAPPVFLWQFSRTEKGKLFLDKFMLRIPIIGSLIHKTLIEVFCRVFYTLYSGSAESIEPIKIAAEASGNLYFEQRIKNVAIPLMMQKGKGLTEAFEASGVFTQTAISRFHSGEETGTIKNTALQLANYYESETVFRLKNIIEIVQVTISMIIMIVMIALTLVSAETATISPKSPLAG